MSMSMSMSSPEVLLKNRFMSFLIWQSIPSTLIFLLFKPFLSSSSSFWPLFTSSLSFLTFHFSLLLFSSTLSLIASPHPRRPAPPLQLAARLLRFLFIPSDSATPDSAHFRARAKVSLSFVLFAAASAASGLAAAVSLCGLQAIGEGFWVIGRVGLRGFFVGLLFGLHYVLKRRWVLEFPIIQRPPYFSFKMGVPSAGRRALKLSIVASVFSAILLELLPHPFKYIISLQRYFTEQIVFSIATFAIFFCWELTHHLHRVGFCNMLLMYMLTVSSYL
ncbi:uncharacterized protein LOC107469197 [Arachis duranensis]|uniref:Uncharacterized protein LOC107469197 n=1 Tax=Arachis duranensis TaxID=130453 RepID=A0A6P4BQH4_ARADU|nr:uncharacterized protein LOC107469197 [Arachis duranensis]